MAGVIRLNNSMPTKIDFLRSQMTYILMAEKTATKHEFFVESGTETVDSLFALTIMIVLVTATVRMSSEHLWDLCC